MDQATVASWHDFYVTMGTAAASLIGLLFVALSLNLDSDRLGEAVFWRFGLPAAAVLGLIAAGIGLVNGQPSALYWLVAVIIGLLMSAARSSWDLLVKVGEERGIAKGPG
jgi:hypothetical protein